MQNQSFREYKFRDSGHALGVGVGAATVLLLGAIVIPDQLTWSGLSFVSALAVMIVVVTALLNRFGDGSYGSLFAYGLLVRILIVSAISAFPPTDFIVSASAQHVHIAGVIFEDEAWYLSLAQKAYEYGIWEWLSMSDQWERIALYYSAIFTLVSDDHLLWGRLFNTFITTFALLFIYDSIRRSTSRAVHRLGWWYTAITPELLLLPVFYLKEPIVVLGVAMILNGSVVLRYLRARASAGINIFAGVTLCLFARPGMLVVLVPIIIYAAVSNTLIARKYYLYRTIVFSFMVAVGLALTAIDEVGDLFGLDPLYFATQYLLAASGYTEFPLMELVSGLPGPLRNLGFTFLLLISPLITGVWNIIPFLGDPTWYHASMAAFASTWWTLLPLWPIAIWVGYRQRDSWLMLLTGVLILWIIIAAAMRFGVGMDAVRYRDALMPLIILLAFRGLDYIVTASRFPGKWLMYIRLYFVGLVFLIFLRGIGVLKM